VQALIWAFKPTEVVDLRYLPKQRRRETAEMLVRLRGEVPPARGKPGSLRNHRARARLIIIAILVLIVACAIFWLVFFKFKWLRLTPGWGIVFAFFVVHLCLVFVIGLRFVTPASTNATIVQHTIQLVPRLLALISSLKRSRTAKRSRSDRAAWGRILVVSPCRA